MKQFTWGFIVATLLWIVLLSIVTIPEYTITHRTTGVCT